MAKINEAIINRAFCKTPLLAAIGVPLGFKRSKMFFMVFIFVQRIGQHTSDTQKNPRKTFQPFSISRNLLLFSPLRLNGFALQTLHNHSACTPVHAVQIASLRVPFRHAQQPELLAEPRNRHALQRLR